MARIITGRRSGLGRSLLAMLVALAATVGPAAAVTVAQSDDATATADLEIYEARSFGFSGRLRPGGMADCRQRRR